MARKKIYIDVGHGGRDPGAIGNGLREKDLTLTIAKKIESILRGVATVKLSRTNDKDLTLKQRTNDANRWGADFLVSIHINAGGGTGFESFIYNGNTSMETKRIQNVAHAEIIEWMNGNGDVRDRGRKQANFHMLRESRMPALLTEVLFIDTKEDADKLKDRAYLDKVAKGHAYGIAKALGLGTPNESAPIAKPTPKPAAKPKVKPTPKTKPTVKANLTVDGKWGRDTTQALQRALGTTADGVISDQLRNSVSESLYGGTVSFGKGERGSLVIKALQRKLGGLKVDGLLGPATVRRLQTYLGMRVVDGKFSRPSVVVRELQRRLNDGTF